MTQRERVMRALQNAGPEGVTAVDFLRFPTLDGGPPITRLAARIQDLRDAGHTIDSSGTRNGCAVYCLKASGLTNPIPPAAPDLDPGAAGTLFDPAQGRRRLGAYDDAEAA